MISRRDAGVLALMLVAVATRAAAQTWRTLSSSRQLHEETSLAVDVRYAAGRLNLAAAQSGTLYRMELRYDEERFTPLREYDATSGSLRLGTRGRGRVQTGRGRNQPQPFLDVELTREVPISLSIEVGAAVADIDLSALAIRSVVYRTGASESRLRFSRPNTTDCDAIEVRAGAAAFRATGLGNANCRALRFDGGVGEVVLDFSGEWRRPMEADIEMGIGELTLRLPRELGVAITIDRFLASFTSAGLLRRGGTYYSENWDRARSRLTLNVDATLGGVIVSWLEP